MLTRWALALIRWYRRKGGGLAFFGIACNFEPSCSAYMEQAIERFGLFRGMRLGIARIRRCNDPAVAKPRPDPVPDSLPDALL